MLSVGPVHSICFTVGEWETLYRFLVCFEHVKKLTIKLLMTYDINKLLNM